MSKLILPINTIPPIKIYNHHAFGTGIVTTIPEGMNWIYNNYILISYYPDEGPLTFDYYMDYIYCQPVFDRESISDELLAVMKWDAVKLFVEAIKQNKYVITCVDEFYIPQREAYENFHFIHNIIIYGFDTDEKRFYTAGYDEHGKYTAQTITYKELQRSKPRKITFLRFRSDLDYEIEPEYIKQQFFQYNGTVKLNPVGSYPREGRLVGVDAVNGLMDYIKLSIDAHTAIDIRPVQLLYEHRTIMKQRIEKLIAMGSFSDDILSEYIDQAKQCDILCKRVMLYNVRQSGKDAEAVTELTEKFYNLSLPIG